MTRKGAVRLHQEGDGRADGLAAEVHRTASAAWSSRDFLPNLGDVRRRYALVRSMHTDQFNHHPGQLMMNCGPAVVRPAEHGNLADLRPGQRIAEPARLRRAEQPAAAPAAGRRTGRSGFLPSRRMPACCSATRANRCSTWATRRGCRRPAAARRSTRSTGSTATRFDEIHDPEIASRIAAYELAFRMQSAAPELIDLSGETAGDAGALRRRPRGPADVGGRRAAGRACSTRSPATACWRGGWSSAACGSSTSIHASWDHHSNLDTRADATTPDGRPADRRAAEGPEAARAARRDAGGLGLRVRPHAAGREPHRPPSVTGRDHHPFAFSIWMAGGGVKGGQVIGETDEIGWDVVEDPVHVNDFHATMLHLFGLDHTRS